MLLNDYIYDHSRLGELLIQKRGRRTLREVAEEIQVSQSTLSRIEGGKHRPDPDTLSILCTWLDMHPGEFFIKKDDSGEDELAVQLRALPNMSPESANALMEAVKALYMEIYSQDQPNEDN